MVRSIPHRRALVASALATVLGAALGAAPAHARIPEPPGVELRLLAFGDLHGNLRPPEGPRSQVTNPDGSKVDAGGAAYLAAYVRQLRSQATNSLLYSVGDSWGSSPIESALLHNEPTVELLNTMGVTAAAVGQHELDEGFTEFRRLQEGGCRPADGCQFGDTFGGAKFPLLAANMTFENGEPATLPFNVSYIEGIPVGVIAVMPHNTAQLVAGDGIAGLRFDDEIEAVDRTADMLDFFGVRAIALLYTGDIAHPTGPEPCGLTDGPVHAMATRASPKVDVIFTADGAQQFNCSYPDPLGQPRAVLQGASHGRMVSVADLMIDRDTRDVMRDRTHAFNQVITRDIAPDPQIQALADRATEKAEGIAHRPVGRIAADLTKNSAPSGETALGNLIADAQLAAAGARGAQLALANADGMRADLLLAPTSDGKDAGVVTYGEAYAVQPFGHTIQVRALTGTQLKDVLEQQFQPGGHGATTERLLASSHNVRYTLTRTAPVGSRISDLAIDGHPVAPNGVYRVAVNKYLAEGGDGFTALTQGTDAVGAGTELEALTGYLAAHSPVVPPSTDRIRVD